MDFEHYRIECAAIFEKLLAAPELPFDDKLSSCLPTQHGLYTIKGQTGLDQYEYLHVGRSIKAATGLRGRIWDQHFWGGGQGAQSDLVDKVVRKQYMQLGIPQGSTTNQQYRRVAQDWIRQRCLVQWLILEDAELRCWAEHYVLAILRPIWGR